MLFFRFTRAGYGVLFRNAFAQMAPPLWQVRNNKARPKRNPVPRPTRVGNATHPTRTPAAAQTPLPDVPIQPGAKTISNTISNTTSKTIPPRTTNEPLWLQPALITVLLLAFLLRIYGIRFGLPHLYYWDEPTIVNRAVRMGSGDLNPHFFSYPALYMYMLFGVSGLTFVQGRLTGHYHSAQDFAAEFFVDPTRVYLAARLTTALIGTLMVLLTYWVGKRVFGARVGLVGALLLAVSVDSAAFSHIAITDVPHACFIIAAYLPIINVLKSGRKRDYLLAGLLIGLGAATKYLAVLLIPTLLLAAWLHTRNSNVEAPLAAPHPDVVPNPDTVPTPDATPNAQHPTPEHLNTRTPHTECPRIPLRLQFGKISLAFFGMGAGFCAGTPYNIIDLRGFLADFRVQMALSRGDGGSSLVMYLQTLRSDFGSALLVVALIGLVLLFRQRKSVSKSTCWVFLSFPLLYFLCIARLAKGFPRYIIPEDPFVALLAAFALCAVYTWLRSRVSRPAAILSLKFAWSLTTFALILPPFWSMLRWDSVMANTVDTRTQALQWAEREIPSGTTVMVQTLYDRAFFNVPLLTDRRLLKLEEQIPAHGKMAQVRERVEQSLRRHPVYHEVPYNEANQTFAALQQSGVSYLFVSDENANLHAALRRDLEAKATAIYRFMPGSLAAQLPDGMPVWPAHITVYRLR